MTEKASELPQFVITKPAPFWRLVIYYILGK
jgi:hypothetical protein